MEIRGAAALVTGAASGLGAATVQALAADAAAPHRAGRTAEFAALVLAAIANPYLNGETIRLDAGLRMTRR